MSLFGVPLASFLTGGLTSPFISRGDFDLSIPFIDGAEIGGS